MTNNTFALEGSCPITEITSREKEIITRLAYGDSYKEIGSNLHITTNTVKYHITNILRKTGYRSTTSLVAYAVAREVITIA